MAALHIDKPLLSAAQTVTCVCMHATNQAMQKPFSGHINWCDASRRSKAATAMACSAAPDQASTCPCYTLCRALHSVHAQLCAALALYRGQQACAQFCSHIHQHPHQGSAGQLPRHRRPASEVNMTEAQKASRNPHNSTSCICQHQHAQHTVLHAPTGASARMHKRAANGSSHCNLSQQPLRVLKGTVRRVNSLLLHQQHHK
jgi:hypothetical protein